MVVLLRHRWRMVRWGSRGAAKIARRRDWLRDLDDITGAIIDASLHIHRDLGPGLLESVYEAVLARTMARRGFRVERQRANRFEYDGMEFEEGFRADPVVDDRVIVELKSVEHPSASSRLRVNQRVAAEPRGDGH